MKSNKKRVLESFIGSYDLNADIQCHHRLTLKLTKNESESGLKSSSISWLVAGINIEDAQC